MPHVELSLIEASRLPRARVPRAPATAPLGGLYRWATVVNGATEPALVLNADWVIVAASESGAAMLGCENAASAEGRKLQDAVTHLVDFTEPPDKLDQEEARKIPPLLAISSGRLARGLMRVRCPLSGQSCTMDAIATPLWEGDELVGSLSFFSQV